MKKYWAVVVSFLMVLSVLVVSPGTYGLGQEGSGRRGKGFTADLTQEQREAIHTKITELREDGATREEIHAAVGEMLERYGVELPEHWGEGRGRMRFFRNLTDEQREAIREKMNQMRSQGATREEIHAAVGEMLERYGVELPEHWGEGRGRMRFFRNLTDEQREAIHTKITELREDGATREEIHAAVGEMLEGYGIELPEHCGSDSETTLSSKGIPTSPNSLSQSYASPNPFNEETNIFYTLSARDDVQIQIYNATGQLVKSFEIGVQDPGTYSMQWDGTYENGAIVSGGVYLYRIEVGGESMTGRLVLLR